MDEPQQPEAAMPSKKGAGTQENRIASRFSGVNLAEHSGGGRRCGPDRYWLAQQIGADAVAKLMFPGRRSRKRLWIGRREEKRFRNIFARVFARRGSVDISSRNPTRRGFPGQFEHVVIVIVIVLTG
jgi:hypothetical protein